ncbi:hypothetical protein GGF31_006515 [Allomyces arbusculus]|nr:hypothetical protein GGF31_006515 [Allomyces arbusculus]
MTVTDSLIKASAQTIYQQSLNLQAAAVSQGIQVRALAETEPSHTLRVINKAGEDVEILIAKKHMNRGEWTTMTNNDEGAVASADNDDWDTIFVRDAVGRSAAVHVPSASEVTVRALSTTPFVSESFRVVRNSQAEDVIAVENCTPRPILVQVTPSVSNNRDVVGKWNEISPGALKQWTRNDSQMVIVQYDGGVRDAVLADPASKIEFGGPEPLVIMPIEDTTHIRVTNQTKDPIEVQVSNYSGGSKAWFTLAPGASDTWSRGNKRWEAVLVRHAGRIVGTYVEAGTHIVVRHLDRGQSVATLEQVPKQSDAGSVLFHNTTDSAVDVFVTKLAGDKGDDAWFTVAAGATERWSRVGTEVMAVRHADGTRLGTPVALGMKVVLHSAQPKARGPRTRGFQTIITPQGHTCTVPDTMWNKLPYPRWVYPDDYVPLPYQQYYCE